ncbi:MAG: hypothetical protein ABIC39_02195, partial [Pseudomonadota bacterium]
STRHGNMTRKGRKKTSPGSMIQDTEIISISRFIRTPGGTCKCPMCGEMKDPRKLCGCWKFENGKIKSKESIK